MKRREIIAHAGRELGDLSDGFLERIVNPALDLVLLELAQREAIGALTRLGVFFVEADRRSYDTREITGLVVHAPSRIRRLTVYAWGPVEGEIPIIDSAEEFRAWRFSENTDTRGKWRRVCMVTPVRLDVTPLAGPDEDGAEVEIEFDAPPDLVQLDDDLAEIRLEDMPVLVDGLRWKLAGYKEEWANEEQINAQKFLAGAARMWGHAKNSRSRVVRPFAF